MKKLKAKVISNTEIAPEHYRMALASAYLARNARPGQFLNIKCGDSQTPLLRKPFSFYKIHKDTVEILYKIVGAGTNLLKEKKKGEILDVIGPLGNGFNAESAAILVGGGHGVAPLVALAQKLRGKRRTLAFIGARAKKHVVCENDFKRLKVRTYVSTEDGSKGYKGLITDLLVKRLTGKSLARELTIFACGPKAMLKQVARIARRARIPCQVLLEEYMACGIGTCMGCAVYTKSGYKMVCKDGPVFDAEEITWQI